MSCNELMGCLGVESVCTCATNLRLAAEVQNTYKEPFALRTPEDLGVCAVCLANPDLIGEEVVVVSEDTSMIMSPLSRKIPEDLSLAQYAAEVDRVKMEIEDWERGILSPKLLGETLVAKDQDLLLIPPEQEVAVDAILSLCEELSSKPEPIVRKKRRVMPQLLLDFESMERHPLGEELAAEADQISLWWQIALEEGFEDASFLNNIRQRFFGTPEVLVPLQLFMSPIETSLPLSIGTMDPLAKERAELRLKKQAMTPTGKTLQTIGGMDM